MSTRSKGAKLIVALLLSPVTRAEFSNAGNWLMAALVCGKLQALDVRSAIVFVRFSAVSV